MINMAFKTVNTILYCDKWQETVYFYETKMSLQVTMRRGWFVEFELNEHARLSIADAKRTSMESSSGNGITISIRVDNVYSAYDAMKSRGLQPTQIKEHPWGAKVTYVRDPEGNRLEFWS